MDVGVKDTAAYKILRQVLDHTWGSDSDLEDEEFLQILSSFYRRGGSWELLMDGDMRSVVALENSIDGFMNARKLARVAKAVAAARLPSVR